MFSIGALFRGMVSPEGAAEIQCFVLSICENLNIFVSVAPRRRCPYFDVVAGLVWSNDPESYAGGSDATGMASRAR
jgi:hypothetical protein